MKPLGNKVPSIFRKPVKREIWDKKFISRIYLPEDRAFLESLLEVDEVDEDEYRIMTEGLSAKNMKRLKSLGKVIKANRRGVSIILLIFLAVIVLGSLCWQFFLKDSAVKSFVENRLEQIFLAEVETEGVDLSLFQGSLIIKRLSIADARNPMMNLVELEEVKAEIDIPLLLKGKIRIIDLGAAGLKRGTARETSGALASDADKPASTEDGYGELKQEKAEGPNLIEETARSISALIGEIDVEELLEQQRENLESFSVIENSAGRVEAWTAETENLLEEWSRRAEQWESTAVFITSINPESFSSVGSAQSTITELKTAYSRAEEDYGEIVRLVADTENKLADASIMIENIKASVDRDLDWVESLVSLPDEGQADWAASIIEQQLGLPVRRYLDYFEKGTDFYQRFESIIAAGKGGAAEQRRAGRSLSTGNDKLPAFILEHAFASGEEDALRYQVDIYNLTDMADDSDGGPRFAMNWDSPASGSGAADLALSGGSISLSSIPFDLEESLISLGIENLAGELSLNSNLELQENGITGVMDIMTDGLKVTDTASEEFLYRIIRQSIDAIIPLSVKGNFAWSEVDGLELDMETELDQMLGNAVSIALEEGAGEGVRLLRAYLEEELSIPLEGFNSLSEDFAGHAGELEYYQNEISSYMNMSQDKIAEIETAAAEIVEAEIKKQIEEQLGEETSAQIEKAADEIQEGIGGLFGF